MRVLEGRVAVVTGAGSGIGRGLAIAYGQQGCNVVVADIEDGPRDETQAMLEAEGITSLAVKVDVADAVQVQALADATIDRFGGAHILCNNAGVGGGGLIKDQQLVDWKWVIDVSLWGVINGLQAFLPHLRAADEAHVMSTASVAGLVAGPGLGPYNAAKYGVVAIMETLHHEMALDNESNVGVSVLCPGMVKTNITTAQRNRPESLRRQRRTGVAGKGAKRANEAVLAAMTTGLEPAEVAAAVVDATKHDRFWVLTHPKYLEDIAHRNQSLADLENPTLGPNMGTA